MSYYKKFKSISYLPFWRPYLSWSYKQGINDLSKLGVKPDIHKKDFTCLLCGVSGEVTADEFIKTVLSLNESIKIIIIDYADEQVEAVQNFVKNKYAKYDIMTIKANTMNLAQIKDESVDWIETDGLLEYFNKEDIYTVLEEWKRVLKKDGFITTREFASQGVLGNAVDSLRIWLGKHYLGVTFYRYNKKSLESVFKESNLQFFSGLSPYYTYRRYSLIKN